MDYAFDWVKTNGIPSESSYPYTGRNGQCKAFTSDFTDTGFVDVPKSSPTQMKMALNIGTVSVGIHANMLF